MGKGSPTSWSPALEVDTLPMSHQGTLWFWSGGVLVIYIVLTELLSTSDLAKCSKNGTCGETGSVATGGCNQR